MPTKAKKTAAKKKRVSIKDLSPETKKMSARDMKKVKGGMIICGASEAGMVICKTNQGSIILCKTRRG